MVVSDLVQGWSIIFGSRVSSRLREFAMSTYSDDGRNTGGFRFGSASYNPSISIGETLVISKKGLTFYNHTDSVQFAIAATTFNTHYPMYLFALNSAGDVSQKGAVRMWYFKIWQGSTLVRDFVPCYRKADGLGGLFDLVEMKFYENKGSGDFVKGADNTQIKLFEKIMDTEFDEPDTLLPKEYQQIEYIESTGTQYINTGYLQKNKVTVDCKFYSITPTKNYLYGSTQSSGAMMYNGLYCNDLLEYDWKEVYYTASDYVTMTQRIVGDDTVVVINNQPFTLKTGTTAVESIIYLFACNGGARLYPTPLRCYYFTIYDNNVLVRDFIPCYRKSDGEIGLFDIVEQKFYTNQGTGTFLKGDIIE
jgi:hypothetical protein